MSKIKVEYYVEDDNFSDEEYQASEAVVYITEDEIWELVRQKVDLKEGQDICQDNFYLHLEK